jgi:hypothetical protein
LLAELPARSYAKTVMVLVPSASGTDLTLQLTELELPLCHAMPLPPRSLIQVTRATIRLSLAAPAIVIARAVALYVVEAVGAETKTEGGRLSTRASATSSVTAFGSTVSVALPPQPAMAMQAAVIAVALVFRVVVRFMIRVIDT